MWSIWVVQQKPTLIDRVKLQFYIAAAAFLFMGVSAAVVRQLSNKGWFVWVQMILDTIFVSALVAASDEMPSPFFFLYCLNITGSVRILNPKGVLTVAILDSMAYLAVGLVKLMDDWSIDPTSDFALVIYTQLLFRIFGLLLIGVLSFSLASRQAATQKALMEQVQKTEMITQQHESLMDQLHLFVFTTENDNILFQNKAATKFFGNLVGTKSSVSFPVNQSRWVMEWSKEEHAFMLEGRSDDLGNGQYVLIIEDVTRSMEIEALAIRKDRLSAVGRLAASLAHEIRNPLASLSGAVQLLSENKENRLHNIILREVKRLNDLVEEFLHSSKPPQLQRSYIEPNSVLLEVLDTFEHDPRCGKRELKREIQPVDVILYLDTKHFRQVLWNLLVNAAQATVEGDRISVSTGIRAGFWELIVADTGAGIPAKMVKNIFDPFYTTRSGGTGLGLANVERIVHAHGGEISVDSTEGEGTSFLLSFPLPKQ